jgi:hypothetical protein
MRKDSSRITTTELKDGTAVIRADLQWLVPSDYEAHTKSSGLLETVPTDLDALIIVRPDKTIELLGDTSGSLRFVGRRSRKHPEGTSAKASYRNIENPLSRFVLQYRSPMPPAGTHKDQHAFLKKHGVQRAIRHEQTRKVWNGMLRRAFDYVDPTVVRLVNSINPTVFLYNALVKNPTTLALVRESRALGVLLDATGVTSQAEHVSGLGLKPALQVLVHAPVSDAFVTYARRQHFTQRFMPGTAAAPWRSYELVSYASEVLADLPAEGLERLRRGEQWAFLNLLLLSPERERLVRNYLSDDPAAFIAAVDAVECPKYVAQHRTGKRRYALEQLFPWRKPTPLPPWTAVDTAYHIAQTIAGTHASYPNEMLAF